MNNNIVNFFDFVKSEDLNITAFTAERAPLVAVFLQYTLICDRMYYGSDCSRYCEDTDDETGHFTCDGEGNPVCLPGYNHSSTNDSRCTQCIENCTAIATTATTTIMTSAAAATTGAITTTTTTTTTTTNTSSSSSSTLSPPPPTMSTFPPLTVNSSTRCNVHVCGMCFLKLATCYNVL